MSKDLEKVAVAYSSAPWWYDLRGFFILTFAYQSTLTSQIRLFSRNVGPRHLEVAIGTGTLFDLILKWRRLQGAPKSEITGMDYAPKMLDGARWRFRKMPDIELKQEDVAHMDFADESFDTVNIANAIHCFQEGRASLTEVGRVLKTNGSLAGNVLLEPKKTGVLAFIAKKINDWGKHKGILTKTYTQNEVREMINSSGFEIEFETVSGNCYNFLARKRVAGGAESPSLSQRSR